MSKNFIHGSLLVFVGLISGKILAMANSIILARYLNADEFGLLLLALSILEFFRIPSNLGVPSILPKFVSEYKEKKQFDKISDIFSVSLVRCFIIALFFAIIIYVFSPHISKQIFHKPELSIILRTLSFILPVSVIIPVMLAMYRGYKITRAKVIFGSLLPYLFRIPIFLILFYAGVKLSAAYYAYIIATALIFIVIRIDIIKTLKVDFRLLLYDPELSPTLFKLSWPLMLQSFVWIIYTRIDRLFIGYYLQSREVAVYSAATSIAGLLSMIPQSFSFLSLPLFSKFVADESLIDLRVVYKKITALMFAISLPIFICLAFLSKDILNLLYGTGYTSGATALLIVSGGILSRCLIGPASDSLIGAGKTKAPLISLTAGCVSNILLNVILIPKYGINGAAIATCISMFISRFTIAWFNYKYLRIVPISGSHFAWTIFTCGLLMPVFFLLKNASSGHLFVDISVSGIVYLLVNYLLLLCIMRFTNFGKKWFSKLNLLISS